MTTTPNNNGRSLEYLIVSQLATNRAYQLTERAIDAQNRDALNIGQVDPTLLNSMKTGSRRIANWIEGEISGSTIEIDRADDGDEGVADIILVSDKRSLNYSIKHNSDSLSHPRPYSIAQKIGHPKGSELDLDHRERMASIGDNFRRAIGRAETFISVPAEKQQLYVDTCVAAQLTLSQAATSKDAPKELFESIVGVQFKKIIVETDHVSKALKNVSVYDYSKVSSPRNFKLSIQESDNSCRLIVSFDNGWDISLRIHTASSRISKQNQLSLKFDAVATRNTLPPAISI